MPDLKNKDVLRLLFPLDLGGVHGDDLKVEGKLLDVAQAEAETLLDEIFPDTTVALLDDWERVYGLPDPCTGLLETESERREALVARVRAKGGQNRQYFFDLADAFGVTVVIVDHPYEPFTCESPCIDPLTQEEWQFVWRVIVLAVLTNVDMECLFERLKPAQTFIEWVNAWALEESLLTATPTGGTFARASTKVVPDHEGLLHEILSGEYPAYGARRVHNLFDNSEVVGTRTDSLDVGDYVIQIWGTGTVDLSGNASGSLTSSGGREELRFSVPAAGNVTFTVTGTPDKWQLERVTGQTIKAGSEYVSNGLLAAPYHGAGVDGVQYFTETRTVNMGAY